MTKYDKPASPVWLVCIHLTEVSGCWHIFVLGPSQASRQGPSTHSYWPQANTIGLTGISPTTLLRQLTRGY